MNTQDLIQFWKAEEIAPFTGWDFSHLSGRMIEEHEPWSYLQLAAERMRRSTALLDMGTGGGERLLELRSSWPARVAATEDYPPNLRLATERLAPLGVEVRDVQLDLTSPMPYPDNTFDLVINRHSAFNFKETARILARGGTFLTQQVHGLWAHDLMAVFGSTPKWPDVTLPHVKTGLQEVGLEVVTALEWSGHFSFTDVGAVVYYLKAVPWEVDNFSVETHLQGLLALQERLERGEPLRFWAGKFLVEAVKPA